MKQHVLVVAPHPDDEAIGCGGSIRKHYLDSDIVRVLYLTSGERNCADAETDAERRAIREEEAHHACKILGVASSIFWQEPDGALFPDASLAERMVELLEQVDMVYVPHILEQHPDHRVAHQLVIEAASAIGFRGQIRHYEVWTPLVHVVTTVNISHVVAYKVGAIRAHESQMKDIRFDDAALCLNRFRGLLYGKCKYAECFA